MKSGDRNRLILLDDLLPKYDLGDKSLRSAKKTFENSDKKFT